GGKLERELEGDAGTLTCLAFSPDGTQLAGGSQEGQVTVWSLSTGAARGQLTRPGAQVASLGFSPDGKTVAVGLVPSGDRTAGATDRLLLWDVTTQQTRILPGHPSGTRCVSFAPDGRSLATGGDDGLLKVWE